MKKWPSELRIREAIKHFWLFVMPPSGRAYIRENVRKDNRVCRAGGGVCVGGVGCEAAVRCRLYTTSSLRGQLSAKSEPIPYK